MKLRYYLDLLTLLVLMVSYIYFILKWKVHRQRNRDFRSDFIALRIRKEKQDPTLTIEEESRYEALYKMGATNAVIHALSNIRSAACLWSYGLLFFTKMLLTKLHCLPSIERTFAHQLRGSNHDCSVLNASRKQARSLLR